MSKSAKNLILAIAIATLLALAAGSALFGRRAYHDFQEKRSVKQAETFLQKNDYRSAALSLRIALGLNPSNVKAAKMMANLLDAGQSPMALGWRRKVAQLEPTLQNKLFYAACALRYETPPYPEASTTLDNIGKEGQTNAAFHLVSAQLGLALSDAQRVENHMKAAVALEPTNLLHKLSLASIQLQSRDSNVAAAARQQLNACIPDSALGLSALRSLASDSFRRKDLPQALQFAAQASSHPNATLDDHLTWLDALNASASPQFSTALLQVQQSCGTNLARITRTLAWMNTHALGNSTLQWTPTFPQALRNAQPVQLAEAEAYLNTSNFAGLETFLSRRKWDDQEFLRLALMARAVREQGVSTHADRLWRQACNSAASDPRRLAVLLQLARAWHWGKEFRDLLWTATDRTPAQQWPLESLLHDYTLQNDTEGLYRVYATLLERNTNSIEFKNNVAALGLLLGTNLTRCASLARESYDAQKTNSSVLTTYAFALHRQGKTTEGLQLLQGLADTELSRPDIALYYGVLLAAQGDHVKAEPYLALAEKHRALPEERALLEKARAYK